MPNHVRRMCTVISECRKPKTVGGTWQPTNFVRKVKITFLRLASFRGGRNAVRERFQTLFRALNGTSSLSFMSTTPRRGLLSRKSSRSRRRVNVLMKMNSVLKEIRTFDESESCVRMNLSYTRDETTLEKRGPFPNLNS